MDRYLKERLVGAAVLVAAAIILIPEMLSGPKDGAPVDAELTHGGEANGVKTYTIDLSAAQGTSTTQLNKQTTESLPPAAPAIVETAPPPPESESTQATNASTQSPTKQPTSSQTTSERDQRLIEEFSAQDAPAQKPAPKTADKPELTAEPASGKMESEKAAQSQGSGGWTVQVASFDARATSERVATDLKSKGYPAFVAAFAAKGQTMYRVRVGPVADRAAAEALLKKIKSLHPKAIVAPP